MIFFPVFLSKNSYLDDKKDGLLNKRLDFCFLYGIVFPK